jgi:ribonucleoside-diphosphate reductase alpha chain
MKIRKRDGKLQDWDMTKVRVAVAKAVRGAYDPPEKYVFNLDAIVDSAERAVAKVVRDKQERGFVDIEEVQDAVEDGLMEAGHTKVARSYILYRRDRAMVRKRMEMKPPATMIEDYIHPAKYAKWLPELKRRETYLETVLRSQAMHVRKFPQYKLEIEGVFERVLDKHVLPSMRSMQFGGEKAEEHNAAIYNCSFSLCDRPRFFAEAFYLLLCGCGVGASIQKQHVAKLPPIRRMDTSKVRHFTVADTIMGWADAVDAMFDAAMEGYWIEYDYSQIRPEGTVLGKSGGRAPGHVPLRKCLETLRELLAAAAGRHLRPIECGDAICHIALAVLSGGIRRSSLILIFSPDDEEMLTAKAEGNFRYPNGKDPGLNAHRQMSNNSACCVRNKTTREQFERLFDLSVANWGDPGIYWTDDEDYGTNPCGEIGLNPTITNGQLMELVQAGVIHGVGAEYWDGSGLGEINERWTGWSFCNLCETNAARVKTKAEFLAAVRAAAAIGTLQASYTNFPYLGAITEAIARRESLLGVGITGIMDNPGLILNGELLREAADIAIKTNVEWAAKLGIRPAARVTTVKPSGTASLELGCVGSGIHPHHAKRYFRRITANPLEPVANYLKMLNPHLFQEKPNGDWCITFPVAAPDTATKFVKNQSASEFLDNVFLVYENWVKPGTARPESSPGLTHNVSATVTAWDHEFPEVRKRLWEERHRYNAISFAHAGSDKGIPYMPREEVVTDADWALWEELITKYTPVDYTQFVEEEDMTAANAEAACAGGACDVIEGAILKRAPYPGAVMLFEGPWQEWDEDSHPDWIVLEAPEPDSNYFYDGKSWWWLPPSTNHDTVKETVLGHEYVWAKAVRGKTLHELNMEWL